MTAVFGEEYRRYAAKQADSSPGFLGNICVRRDCIYLEPEPAKGELRSTEARRKS